MILLGPIFDCFCVHIRDLSDYFGNVNTHESLYAKNMRCQVWSKLYPHVNFNNKII